MEIGSIRASGTAEELQADPNLNAAYFGHE